MLFIAPLVLAAVARAIQITAPTNTSGWETSGSEVITWTSVDTDPSQFTIQLVTPADPNNPTTIAANVSTSDGSYTYTPSADLAAGDDYRVNFISAATDNTGILAQSDYFDVESGSSEHCGRTGARPRSRLMPAPSLARRPRHRRPRRPRLRRRRLRRRLRLRPRPRLPRAARLPRLPRRRRRRRPRPRRPASASASASSGAERVVPGLVLGLAGLAAVLV